jgi:hypothetical protein
MDPDPDADPSIFIIDLQDANKKSNISHKTVEIKVFLTTYFCLMIEESGSIA